MKRFWKTACVVPEGQDHAVQLDGRPVKLPSGKPLTVPFGALAAAIAEEWAQAGEDFTPDDLPMTRLASTAQERINTHRADIVQQLAAYGMNDLLCYRAETPASLVAQQAQSWDKWLDWAGELHGIRLRTTGGIQPIDQAPEMLPRLTDILSGYSDYQLAALGVTVPALGSLILSLALASGHLDAAEACETAMLDELWQEAQWGQDKEALARRRRISDDIAVSLRFMQLARPEVAA
jgi:chaperone required for assembly of F1-ATPase